MGNEILNRFKFNEQINTKGPKEKREKKTRSKLTLNVFAPVAVRSYDF